MLTDKQLADRKIGGSDIATILGLNPWRTAEELRLEILGRLPLMEGNEAMEAGEIMEEGVRQLYARRTGRTVNRSHQTLVHPGYDFLTAHIDGRIVGERRGLECKNIHWRMAQHWGEPGSDQIPEYYLPQVMHYMLVLDYPLWDVAAYFGGPDLRIYTVERDPEWDEIILDLTNDFWHRHVGQDIPCGTDVERPDALRVLKRIYPGTNGTVLTVPNGASIISWHDVYRQSSELRAQYEKSADLAKAHMLRHMKEASVLELPDGGRYVRKLIERKGYSVEATSYIDMRYKAPKE